MLGAHLHGEHSLCNGSAGREGRCEVTQRHVERAHVWGARGGVVEALHDEAATEAVLKARRLDAHAERGLQERLPQLEVAACAARAVVKLEWW